MEYPFKHIRKEPCEGWIIVLFMLMCFVIGCVDRMCKYFFQDVSFFSTIVFGFVVVVVVVDF